MSFPTVPLHVVFFKTMTDNQLYQIIDMHCQDFDRSVYHFCVSLAKLIRDNPASYSINKYGIKSARATNSNPEIVVDCIDDTVVV